MEFPEALNEYRFDEEIGCSQRSTVHKAFCVPLKQEVAIKCVNISHYNVDVERLSKELKNISQEIVHPNITRIYTAFVQGTKLYIVMELLSGSFRDVVVTSSGNGIESEEIIAEILWRVLDALECLHSYSHVHGGLRISNVLYGDNTIKITDHYISAMLDTGSKIRKQRPNGPPEKARDQRGDIWSFGILGLQLALGQLPQTLSRAKETAKRRYSAKYIELIFQCLLKEPRKRPTTERLMEHEFFKKRNNIGLWELLDSVPPAPERLPRIKETLTKKKPKEPAPTNEENPTTSQSQSQSQPQTPSIAPPETSNLTEANLATPRMEIDDNASVGSTTSASSTINDSLALIVKNGKITNHSNNNTNNNPNANLNNTNPSNTNNTNNNNNNNNGSTQPNPNNPSVTNGKPKYPEPVSAPTPVETPHKEPLPGGESDVKVSTFGRFKVVEKATPSGARNPPAGEPHERKAERTERDRKEFDGDTSASSSPVERKPRIEVTTPRGDGMATPDGKRREKRNQPFIGNHQYRGYQNYMAPHPNEVFRDGFGAMEKHLNTLVKQQQKQLSLMDTLVRQQHYGNQSMNYLMNRPPTPPHLPPSPSLHPHSSQPFTSHPHYDGSVPEDSALSSLADIEHTIRCLSEERDFYRRENHELRREGQELRDRIARLEHALYNERQ